MILHSAKANGVINVIIALRSPLIISIDECAACKLERSESGCAERTSSSDGMDPGLGLGGFRAEGAIGSR